MAAEMKLGQSDSYVALRGEAKKPSSSIKSELLTLATSVVQKWKVDRWMRRLDLV